MISSFAVDYTPTTPATPTAGWFWSSTNEYIPVNASATHFNEGGTLAVPKSYGNYVRLVRGGQPLDSFDAHADTTPNAFTFNDQPGVSLSANITSAPVLITGIGAVTGWSASGGMACVSSTSNCISCAPYTSNGTIMNNQYMCARHTSSASYLTATDTPVTVGGVSDTFTSTTLNLPLGHLNDTGQDTCYNGSALVACSVANSGNAAYPR